jgi:2'-5' RNA ligase
MDTTTIVALPRVDDRVNKVSSEKAAHLTLCFLGETANLDLETIVLFVKHAASQLSPFGLQVDYRDTLGPKDADVLFFKTNDNWSFPRISDFRGHLLKNDALARAYASVEQYPEWTPHLTLGYPDKPANDDDLDYGINYVEFDRIAVWTEDSEGPEFRLEYDDTIADGVAWSAWTPSEIGAMAAATIFNNDPNSAKHYGVKGMRWGVTTKDRAAMKAPVDVKVTQKKAGTFAKTEGGQRNPLTNEAKETLAVRQKAKASTTDALTNAELRTAIQRMQLEQQYKQLEFASDRRSRGARFVAGLFGNPRYGKEKLRFKDMDEELGGKVGSAIKKSGVGKKVAKAVVKKAVTG